MIAMSKSEAHRDSRLQTFDLENNYMLFLGFLHFFIYNATLLSIIIRLYRNSQLAQDIDSY